MKPLYLIVVLLCNIAGTKRDLEANESLHFIENHCAQCHSETEPAGGFDLKSLVGDLANQEIARRWTLVHDRIVAGEMPPGDEPQLGLPEKEQFLKNLSRELTEHHQAHRQVILRRLNRREYENTVRDLFGTYVEVHGLPADSVIDGFDTVGEGLSVSAEAMQAYLDASEQVLDSVFGPAKKPQQIRHETNLLKQVDWQGRPQLDSHIGSMFRKTQDGLVIFQSNYCPTNLVNFARLRAPTGTYRGTIRARAIQSDTPVTLRIYGGDTIVNRGEQHLVGYFDVPPDEWTTIEFTDRLVEGGGTYLPKCYGTRDTRKDADTYPEPGIEIGDIVIEGPLEAWPPESRVRLLGDIQLDSAGEDEARSIIIRLLPRAFRRPIESHEADPYIQLFKHVKDEGRSFEAALRVSLSALLCSPEFLFLDETTPSQVNETTASATATLRTPSADPAPINQHALASRLSYFLWSSMPDAELTSLADQGRLNKPEVLAEQVERLLTSEKSSEFTRNFAGQWLALRDIQFTEPEMNLYPEFDELLRISMVRETELFFEAILHENLSVTNFVDADFTFLNGRLASHYGIAGVEGQEFQRVPLPDDSIRGGLLTQASILKVTANGTYTSPVLRGVWILNNILGTPTSPPPDNVGSVEPDIRGATTIREQLARHRADDSCASCHSKIDPPGFVLENFDPIGGFRTRYRTMAENAPRPEIRQAPFTYEWVRYRIGQPVDATCQLVDGRSLQDVRQYKNLLASNPSQLTRNLAQKLLTYSLGRRLGFSDRAAIEDIISRANEHDYGFRSIIHAVVQSPLFQQP